MLAAQWDRQMDDSMQTGPALLGIRDHQQQQSQMQINEENEEKIDGVLDQDQEPDPTQYPSMKPLGATNIVSRYPSCNTDDVMVKYRTMMHGPIKLAFRRAADGKLYKSTDTASVKLPLLEQELKKAMKGHVKDTLIDRWTVCSSNVFGEDILNKETTPVLITLNCSPVDDGSKCCHARKFLFLSH